MIDAPAVSVILPFYNASATLERAVSSIVKQSFTDWELLLIDDGSTDTGYELAQKRAAADQHIRLIRNDSNCGIVFSLNKGIDNAKAGLLARMDADDWSHPERLEKQVRYLQQHPETGLVSCGVKHEGSPSQKG